MPAKSRVILLLKYPIICLFIFLPCTVHANFDFNANCLKAYQLIFELKLNAARQLIVTEKRAHPKNAIVPLLENYVDYFYLITTESKDDFERLKEEKSKRLDLIEDEDSNSPYYLYAQAEINLQWALLRSRYGEYFTAAREIKKASSELQENSKKYPGFRLNAKGIGLINVFLGNLPDGLLKTALSAFGIKGDVQKGIAMLDNLAQGLPRSTYEPFYEEVVFYYSFVLSDIVHAPDAYAKTMKYTARIADSSLLKAYLQAYVCARNAHNDEAIAILANRPTGDAYQPFPYLELLMGTAKLNKLDYSATVNFKKFLALNKGCNYIKDANLHLSWVALLNGDTGAYKAYTAKVKAEGYTYGERDKQAMNEALAPTPNHNLLTARLLFDGGYFNKAAAILADERVNSFSSMKDKAEFCYRSGRIAEALDKDDTALVDYQGAVNYGKGLKYYYAANSALNMGKIYARKKSSAKAKAYFNQAINMKDHEYANSIEAQAKDGLKHVGN
ncbi:tetratricopeptide repeat protein [Pedobacter sp. L105]|uniref:tetratricopeptide repeat protein n=1 Tax=Pedobacter sp. L105 TaxID=1641871 RepID=UPI0020B11633|nr:tetratricopeptide repeat protein [Pedobacter sp. L105]